ncbi:hypothetical protein GT022_07305 [Agaribacter marinus]|uniref:Uncharacterized protein n=1 Tax=Virgibacillus salarius TaxID=447199 RepID=A0A941IC57_9BACI|nr:hypothetical protein [Virgibacillus salarius]MBR7795855.1 hypothetical protein [Virgibacillus salarius]NAZ08567.1 hypothetical protein [Agaribacter marinus]
MKQQQEQGFGDQDQEQSQGDEQQQQEQGFGDQDQEQSQGDEQQQQEQGFGDQDQEQSQGDEQQQQEQGFGDQDQGQSQGDEQQQQEQGFGDQDQEQSQGDEQQQQEQGFGDQDQGQSQGDEQQQQEQGFGDQDQGQSQGDEQQQQGQGFGDQDQEQSQGNQELQQGQGHGGQIQNQGDQDQGPQIQNQEHGDQRNGDQINEGHTNISPLENDQTISTPVDVDGVTVNVKCGDCVPFPFFPPHDDRKDKCKCKRCKNRKCSPDCDNCTICSCNLLEMLQSFQITTTDTDAKQVDLYISSITSLSNPIENQTITDIIDCCIVKLKPASQPEVIPSTTVQLCDIAGIRAENSTESPNALDFIIDVAREMNKHGDDHQKDCNCPRCAKAMGDELACAARFGILVNISITGLTTPLSLYVLNVKDCFVFLVDDLMNPSEIFAFSLCSVVGFTVESQTI